MPLRLGLDAKSYRNTGTYSSPTWNEIKNMRDVGVDLSKAKGNATTRGSNGWKLTVGTIREATIEFEMLWDTADDDFNTFRDSFLNRTPIEMAFMDSDVAVAGAQGLRASFEVMKWSKEEGLEGEQLASVSLEPTYSANPPAWYTST